MIMQNALAKTASPAPQTASVRRKEYAVMNRIRRDAFILLAVLAIGACPAAGAGDTPAPAELRQMLEEGAKANRIQTKLPSEQVTERRRATSPGKVRAQSGGSISQETATILLIAALAVFAAVFFFTLRDNSAARPAKAQKGNTKVDRQEEEELIRKRMAAAGQESDVLAANGDYAGAMHALLLQSLEEMRRRLRASMAASMTSREILHRTRMDEAAHAAFADIVSRVEISYFGNHLPGKEEYELCRTSYSTLSRILGGGGRQ